MTPAMPEEEGDFEFVEDEKKPFAVHHEGIGAKHPLCFNERGKIDEEKLIFDIRQAEKHLRQKARKSRARRALKKVAKFGKLVIVIALLYSLVGNLKRWLGPPPHGPELGTPSEKKVFDWDDVKPSKQLNYVPCLTDINPNYQCAKLSLPLDPLNSSETREVHLAIIKLPAPVDVTSDRYGGAFLAHPGGPGLTGQSYFTMMEGRFATYMQRSTSDLTGLPGGPKASRNAKNGGLVYDIITLDPRGVGASRPIFMDFNSSLAKSRWDIETQASGDDLQDDGILRRHIINKKAYGRLLRAAFEDEKNIGKYIGTTNTVRDLLGIAAAHAEWREKEAQRQLSRQWFSFSRQEKDQITGRTKNKGHEEMLNLWGSSYSSLVVQYFASMYPHRYNRIIADAVINPVAWTNVAALPVAKSLEDTIGVFARECSVAGPMSCRLWDPSGYQAIKKTLYEFLDSVRTEGALFDVVDGAPVVVDYHEIAGEFIGAFYEGKTKFKDLDDAIWSAMRGDLSPIARNRDQISCKTPGKERLQDIGNARDAVICIDARPDIWEEYTQSSNIKRLISETDEVSPSFGQDMFKIWNSIPCAELADIEVPSHLRYLGPFGFINSTTSRNGKKPNAIQFASSEYDPVTPLEHAREARDLFPGAGLLVNGGVGHSTKAWENKCVEDKLREYVATGEVDPDNEIWCEQAGHADWNRDEKSETTYDVGYRGM